MSKYEDYKIIIEKYKIEQKYDKNISDLSNV